MMKNDTAAPLTEKHKRHQAMLDRHKQLKAWRREDHRHPQRTRGVPPNSLK